MVAWLLQMNQMVWRALMRRLHHFLFLVSYRFRREKSSGMPLVVNFEPTNYCNLRCPMCPVSQTATSPEVARGFANRELSQLVASQVSSYGPVVAINMGGESTLHNLLPEIATDFRNAGCKVILDTNGLLLSADLSRRLVRSGISELTVCIDGDGTEESYSMFRVRGTLPKVLNNTKDLLAIRDEEMASGFDAPMIVIKNIQHYSSSHPPSFPESIQSYFQGQPPDVYRLTFTDYWPGDHVNLLHERYPVEPFHEHDLVPCPNLWKKIAVAWDGGVYICCLDLNRTHPIGNLHRESISSIWNGKEMSRLRRLHAEGRQREIKLCSNCTMIRRRPQKMAGGLISIREERQTRFEDERPKV